MNTKQLLIFLLVIGIFAFLVVVINHNPGLSEDDAYEYSSRGNALVAGLREVTGENHDINVIDSWIINTRIDGNKEYCLFAIPYEESGTEKHYSFVALIDGSKGKYAFFKLTADVSLNSPGDIQDQKKSDSIVFFFDDVDGYYICVGKVFRDNVVPLVNGQQLEVNQDGIFSYFNKGKRPEIAIH
jgi:hypothetical protein